MSLFRRARSVSSLLGGQLGVNLSDSLREIFVPLFTLDGY